VIEKYTPELKIIIEPNSIIAAVTLLKLKYFELLLHKLQQNDFEAQQVHYETFDRK